MMANTGVFGGPLNKLVPKWPGKISPSLLGSTRYSILQGLHHLGKANAKKVIKATGELSGYPLHLSFAHV